MTKTIKLPEGEHFGFIEGSNMYNHSSLTPIVRPLGEEGFKVQEYDKLNNILILKK